MSRKTVLKRLLSFILILTMLVSFSMVHVCADVGSEPETGADGDAADYFDEVEAYEPSDTPVADEEVGGVDTDDVDSFDNVDNVDNVDDTDDVDGMDDVDDMDDVDNMDDADNGEFADDTDGEDIIIDDEELPLASIEEEAFVWRDIEVRIYAGPESGEPLNDGTSITISGLFPEGAYADAYPVTLTSLDDEGFEKILAAFDISVYDADGESFVLTETATVSVTLPDMPPFAADDELSVLYITDDGQTVNTGAEVTVTDDGFEFAADHFSIYAVVMTLSAGCAPVTVYMDVEGVDSVPGDYMATFRLYARDDYSNPLGSADVTVDTDTGSGSGMFRDGKGNMLRLKPGGYVVVEETATDISGYDLISVAAGSTLDNQTPTDENRAYQFTVERGGAASNIYYISTYSSQKSEVTILKKNHEGDALKGAVFILERYNGTGDREKDESWIWIENDNNELNGYFVTDDDGKITVPLAEGDYRLIEVSAPEGYAELTEPVYFTVDADGLTVIDADGETVLVEKDGGYVVTIINYLEGYVLPNTGGMGVTLFTGVGAAAALCGAGALFASMRRFSGGRKKKRRYREISRSESDIE